MKLSRQFPLSSGQIRQHWFTKGVSWGFKATAWSASLTLFLGSTNVLAVNHPQEDPRFTCQFFDGEYTVMYHPESQPDQAYAWATPGLMGGGWTPERRCNEISRRLEFYRPDGLLEMRIGTENNYNIICVTTQKSPDYCQIVLTVPPGQDPQLTRDRVFENLTIADSGESTAAVNTFVEKDNPSDLLDQVLDEGLSVLGIGQLAIPASNSIDLRPFLDPADGGTGTQLYRGTSVPSTPSLNPDNFR